MPKKNVDETIPTNIEPEPQATKPAHVRRTLKNAIANGSTQTTKATEPDQEPVTEIVIKKSRRGLWILFGIIGMLFIIGIGSGIAYATAIQHRIIQENSQRDLAAGTQYELALIDQQNGRLAMAKQRFEYVISIYPDYPGVGDKLKEVMISIALAEQVQPTNTNTTPQPEATVNPTLVVIVPTIDSQSTGPLLQQAETQLAAKDWQGLFNTVVKLRNIDPGYNPIRVDDLYYMALRNMGIAKIQSGSLEVGLYFFALAEQIGPIDSDIEQWRTWTQMYLTGASWWGSNWVNAISYFSQLSDMGLTIMDSSRYTVRQRYGMALEGYGDYLQFTLDWCGAVPQYEKAVGIYASPTLLDKIPQARKYCANPPPTPTPTYDPFAPTPTPTKKPRKN